MMSKKAMKLALEALEYIYEGANNQGPHTGISWRCVSNKAAPVITALRQALANEALDKKAENARELGLDYEPAQQEADKPTQVLQDGVVEYVDALMEGTHEITSVTIRPKRTWVSLTNNELQPIADEYRILFGSWVEDFARAIEAKLKAKNFA